MVVAPNINVIKRGVLIGFATKLCNKSNGILVGKSLSQSLVLPTTTIRVVGTHKMVFTNLIMTNYVNRIVGQPLMSSMVARRYKSANAMNPRGGYQKPSIIKCTNSFQSACR
jgi:hypothetical protein